MLEAAISESAPNPVLLGATHMITLMRHVNEKNISLVNHKKHCLNAF